MSWKLFDVQQNTSLLKALESPLTEFVKHYYYFLLKSK